MVPFLGPQVVGRADSMLNYHAFQIQSRRELANAHAAACCTVQIERDRIAAAFRRCLARHPRDPKRTTASTCGVSSRGSPDKPQTGINVRVFPALLQDRREVLTATSTSGNPNVCS